MLLQIGLITLRPQSVEEAFYSMQRSSEDEAVESLNHFLDQTNSAVWIGAGLSLAAGYPNWGKLIGELCLRCGVPSPDTYRELDTGGLQDLADECKSRAPFEYQQHLADVFAEEPVRSNFAYDHLLNLKLHAYITTNFDPILERAARNRNPGCRIYDYPDLTPRGLGEAGRIFYIHGRARRRESHGTQHLVLSTREFEDAYKGATWCFLYDLFTYFPILFVGYSIGERQIRELLETANKMQKLIQATDDISDPPRKAVLVDISPATNKGREDRLATFMADCKRLRIEVIPYDAIDRDHKGLVKILAKLVDKREKVQAKRGTGAAGEERPL